MQNRNWLVSNSHLEFAAAPRDQSVDVKLQSYSTARHFETSHAFRIAHQKIRQSQRNGIERATRRHAKLTESGASAILHRSLKSCRNRSEEHTSELQSP